MPPAASLRGQAEEDHAIPAFPDRGLSVPVSTPLPLPATPERAITAEAGLNLPPQFDLRVEPLVQAGDDVAQGAPVLRDRRRPECVVAAAMSGRVAQLEVGAGRRLASLVIHADGRDARHVHDPREAAQGSPAALRALLQASGLWMRFRARPFGRVPAAAESAASIFVMAVDTRPLAPDPRLAAQDADTLDLGLRALGRICEGPVHLCQDRGPAMAAAGGRLRIVHVGPLHPSGLAGTQIHRLFPAGPDRPVWDIAVEDVVAIGRLLADGRLPRTRLVSVAGPGMRQTRLVRCQPGADLRELCHAHMTPGQRAILSGPVPEGREARWLGWFDRQATVVERPAARPPRHWLDAALRGAARAEPIIATAAVEHALGGAMPGMALLRALSVGDDEAAADLGALSLLEEDLALVDYVTSAAPRFADLLRAALDRIEADA